jgi:hypothetical protein
MGPKTRKKQNHLSSSWDRDTGDLAPSAAMTAKTKMYVNSDHETNM